MAGNKTADELLKWSLRQTDDPSRIAQISEDIAQGKRPDLSDPKLYDALMGKSEAQMMQEELAAALDEKRDEEDRCTALDNFEMVSVNLATFATIAYWRLMNNQFFEGLHECC